jgi:hypothetical protein
LERRIRLLTIALGACAACTLWLSLLGFTRSQVLADRVTLQSPKGYATAELRVSDDGTLTLAVGQQVVDSSVKFRSPVRGAALELAGDHDPVLTLRGVDGRPAVRLGTDGVRPGGS